MFKSITPILPFCILGPPPSTYYEGCGYWESWVLQHTVHRASVQQLLLYCTHCTLSIRAPAVIIRN